MFKLFVKEFLKNLGCFILMITSLFVLMLTCISVGSLAYRQSILIYSKNTSEIIAGIVALVIMSVGLSVFFSLQKVYETKRSN